MKSPTLGTPMATRLAAQHISAAQEHCEQARATLLDLLAIASEASDSVVINLLLEVNLELTGLSFELMAHGMKAGK